MADLQALRDFAADPAHPFGLTHPLTHRQVVTMAREWLPEVRFHPDERFHPISLDQRIDMVEERFGQLPAADQEQWRVSEFVRTGANTGADRRFDPPIVYVPDGRVGDSFPVRVLNDGSPTRDAFEDQAVDGDAVFTQGPGSPPVRGLTAARVAREFFGARQTLAEEQDPDLEQLHGTPGNPLLPRAGGITVMATYKTLLDLLKYELLVEEAGDAYPPDALRGGFDIAETLFDGDTEPHAAGLRRQVLLDLIAAHEAGDDSATTPTLPPGWKLNSTAWDAVTRYAFLEYDFSYAYNDWERYQVATWDNEHEGDDEGCCLVFDRNVINLAAGGGDDQLRRAVPHWIITCVHEKIQDADLLRVLPTPIPPADDPDRLPRQDMNLVVYAAGGSHATYLTPGTHDVLDFGTFWAYPEDFGGGSALLPAAALPVLILLAMWEHFQDTEDFTSDDGVHTGPPEVIGEESPANIPTTVITMPMSARNHIYMDQHADLLRLRAYAGRWGAHSGIIDHSTPYEVKTGRYFRELLRHL